MYMVLEPSCGYLHYMRDDILKMSMPLVQSIAQGHSKSLQLRPYVRWILAKTRYGPLEQHSRSVRAHLEDCHGLTWYFARGLPQYVPNGTENPGWGQPDADATALQLANLALNTAKEMEDYETEALALKIGISLSPNPVQKFDELCYLQKVLQGDIEGYMDTLVSKFLVCLSEDSKVQLRKDLAEQIFTPEFENSFSPDRVFISAMLFSALHPDELLRVTHPRWSCGVGCNNDNPDELQVSQAMEMADGCWHHLSKSLQKQVDYKLPGHRHDVPLRNMMVYVRNRKKAFLEAGGQTQTSSFERVVDGSDEDASNSGSEQLDLIVKPHALRQKELTVSFEDIHDDSNKKEIRFQEDLSDETTEQHGGYENRHGQDKQRSGRPLLRPNKHGGMTTSAEQVGFQDQTQLHREPNEIASGSKKHERELHDGQLSQPTEEEQSCGRSLTPLTRSKCYVSVHGQH